jgi:hypothetical protein
MISIKIEDVVVWRTERALSDSLKSMIPYNTTAAMELPDGEKHTVGSGRYSFNGRAFPFCEGVKS